MAFEIPDKEYYAQRQGRGPMAGRLSFESTSRLVISVIDAFREKGYFQKAFGYECVDAGDVPGDLGNDPGAYFLRTIMRDGIWPYWESVITFSDGFNHVEDARWTLWDLDTLCDVIEVLHDLVAKPVSGRLHSYADCGWHYDKFDVSEGQLEFRREIGKVLRRSDPPLDIDPQGCIIEPGPSDFNPLLRAGVPAGTDHDLITKRINSAVNRFQIRGANVDERHAAVRDLADVLEAIRPEVKLEMLSKDEAALFRIANEFAIRHNNRKQRGDYDRPTWLRWTFYVYLATIHAVLRTKDRTLDENPAS